MLTLPYGTVGPEFDVERVLIILTTSVKVGNMRVAQHKPSHPEKVAEPVVKDGEEGDSDTATEDTAEVAKKSNEKLTVSGAVTKVC